MVLARKPNLRSRFGLEALDRRDVPNATVADVIAPTPLTESAPNARRFAIGSAAGEAGQVSVYDANTNALLTMVTPFGRSFTGGVRVATGDVNGDGVDDVVVATGSGRPMVAVIDGASGQVVSTFATSSAMNGSGAFVAVGDVTGDGKADIVVGDGARGRITVYQMQNLAKPVAAYAIDTGFTGGVRVAVGDVNGDGVADIVAASTGPLVKVYNSRGAWNAERYPSGPRYDTTVLNVGGTGGVFVAAGDFDGDGKADVAVGRVVNDRATVSVYKSGVVKNRLFQAFSFNDTQPGGVPVALRDLDGDGRAELLVGGGSGVSQVRVFNSHGGLVRGFKAFTPSYTGGVFVG